MDKGCTGLFLWFFPLCCFRAFFLSICSSPLKWRQGHESVQSSINQPPLLTSSTEHYGIQIMYVMPRIVALSSKEGLRLVCWNQGFAGSPVTDIFFSNISWQLFLLLCPGECCYSGALVWLSPVWLKHNTNSATCSLPSPLFSWFTAKTNRTPGLVPLSSYFCQWLVLHQASGF